MGGHGRRARALPEELLHERVDGEWSFIETLRHLLFVHRRLAAPGRARRDRATTRSDLPHDEMRDLEGVPHDADARPSLDEVLALRDDRLAAAREFFAGLTDELLAGPTTPVTGPGYPEAGSYRVPRCLRAVLDEEWWHRRFAERDLSGPGGPGQLSGPSTIRSPARSKENR